MFKGFISKRCFQLVAIYLCGKQISHNNSIHKPTNNNYFKQVELYIGIAMM